jgi:pyruvate dehydrogenase E1 component
LILTVASSNASSKDEKIIPKDTENLIREAEQALKAKEKEKENVIQNNKIITPEKPEIIQVINDGDIDPVETQEWLESLSAVIDKDGNHRAHYLIKELINKAYMQGVNIPYTQNTPYINTIPANEEKKSTGRSKY